jgi:transcriptional regulator with XRE-family HTH domain
MAEKAREEQLQQFIRDFTSLRNRYSLKEIAKQLELDTGNLSSYSSGNKKPGLAIIKKFYERFGKEVITPDSNSYLQELQIEYKSPEVHSPSIAADDDGYYLPSIKANEAIRTNNAMIESLAEMQRSLSKIIEVNQSLARSVEKVVQANLHLIESKRPSVKSNSNRSRVKSKR